MKMTGATETKNSNAAIINNDIYVIDIVLSTRFE